MDLKDFMQDVSSKMLFARNAGDGFLNGNYSNTMKTIVEALMDSCSDESNGKTRIHEVVGMSRFLRILGNQTIQCTLQTQGVSKVSYVVRTTNRGIESINTIPGKQRNATIDLDIDLDSMINNIYNGNGVFHQIKPYAQLLLSSKNTWQVVNAIRLCMAIGTDIIASSISQKMNVIKSGCGM